MGNVELFSPTMVKHEGCLLSVLEDQLVPYKLVSVNGVRYNRYSEYRTDGKVTSTTKEYHYMYGLFGCDTESDIVDIEWGKNNSRWPLCKKYDEDANDKKKREAWEDSRDYAVFLHGQVFKYYRQ